MLLFAGGNADILYVWGSQSGPYMQALHFGFSFGALLGPIASEPFLAKKILICHGNDTSGSLDSLRTTSLEKSDNNGSYTTIGNAIHATNNLLNESSEAAITTMTSYTAMRSTINDSGIYHSQAAFNLTNQHSMLNTTEFGLDPNQTLCVEVYGETQVQYAFMLACALLLTSTLGYVYVYFRLQFSSSTNKVEVRKASKSDREGDAKNRREMSVPLKVLFLSLLSILISTYCILEDGFSSFLMTFGLEYLGWDKSTGALATTTFWTTLSISRFLGIFTVSCCDGTRMLTIYYLLLSFGIFGFLFSSMYLYYELIWMFTGLLGFSMSVIFPAIFSWTSDNIIHVSGKISSLFLTSSSFTAMIHPILIGNLMEFYHPMWFVYVLVIGLCLELAVFVFIRILVKCIPDSANIRTERQQQITEGTEMEVFS